MNDVVIVEYSEGCEKIIRILLHSALFNCGWHNGVIMRCCVCFVLRKIKSVITLAGTEKTEAI